MPLTNEKYLPHERACCLINCGFVFFQFVYCTMLIQNFIKTQSAVFFLRTAPIIDKNFQKKYTGANDINSVREIQLGMQKYDKQRDFQNPFEESEAMLRDTMEP